MKWMKKILLDALSIDSVFKHPGNGGVHQIKKRLDRVHYPELQHDTGAFAIGTKHNPYSGPDNYNSIHCIYLCVFKKVDRTVEKTQRQH